MRGFVDDLENVTATAHRTGSDAVAAHEQLAGQPTQ
jgi:hypothetical protein